MTTSENYIEHHHHHMSAPSDEGFRTKNIDVWYATRPTVPSIEVINAFTEEVSDEFQFQAISPWTINMVGNPRVSVYGREDIRGLRGLLDAIEAQMDLEDLAKMLALPAEGE